MASQTGQDKNSILSTPAALFVNAASNNYQLSATSPAIDAGVSALNGHNAPTVDIVGTTRPQGSAYDIGAYELIASAPGVATHFSITAPASTTAGSPFSITVTALDAFNNTATTYLGTVHFTSSDGGAVLPSNYQFVVGDAGVHTFANAVTLKTSGTKSVTATDTVTSTITGSASLTVNAAAVSKLRVNGYPSPTTAGVSHNVTVTAQDAFSNTVTGYTGTVHFTSTDGAAVLPADYTFASGDSGVHSFSATLKTAGSQSITATDTATSSINGSQSGITVNGAAASKLVVSGYPASTTAGVSHSFTVTALDAFNNTAAGYTGTMTFSSTDLQAALPANYTFVSGDAGVHTFSATLKTAGSQSITATDTATSSIKGSEAGITVSAAATSKLLVSGYSSPTTAGVSHNFTVTAKDAFNNTTTGYTGTVHFTSSDIVAVLPADYSFLAGDNGVHTFSATLKTAGSQSITATDTATSSIKGSQANITVNPAAASKLLISGYSTPTTAGVSHSFTVTAQDAFNNTATGYTGTVHFTSSDGSAVLPANYSFVAADAGVHSFSATLKTAGSQSITATDTVTSSINGSQTSITVNAAAASKLVVSGYPASTIAGISHSFTVTAQDAFNNTATGYTGTVHFTSSDVAAVLPANYTFVGADAGVHVFSATLKTAGSRSITVTDTATGSITGTESGITVNPGAISGFRVSAPGSVTAGLAFTVTVTAIDSFTNVVSSYLGTVHFTSSDGQAVLPADYTFQAADSGVHVFTNGVMLKTVGSQTVTATDTVSSSLTGQATITVNSGSLTPALFARSSSDGQVWGAVSNGSSAFLTSSWAIMSTGVTWVDVLMGDFNGDGKTDIVARAAQSGDVWVGISTGSSFQFSRWTTWSTGVNWLDVQVGDFNGDGKADLVARVQQTGQWWMGQSTGSSFSESLWATWSTGASWADVRVGDFNGDGRDDLAAFSLSNGQWWVAQSNGNSFSSALWATWSTGATWVDVQVADFNGDGKADITARALQNGQWYTAISNGSNAFTTSLWATWSTGATWVDVKIGDFNGDGKADIIGRALENGQWYAGISNGTVFNTSFWAAWSTGATWVDVQVADFNRDGKSDITARALQNGQWYTGLSNGSVFNTTLWATWSTGVTWVDVRVARNL